MNKDLFKSLCLNYNKEPNKELYEVWEYNLRCFDEQEIKKAINIILTNDKYFPTLNRLLDVTKQIVKDENVIYDENYKKQKMKQLNIIPEWLKE